MTIRERFGGLEGARVAYLGDGNNVCHSLMRIAARYGHALRRRLPARATSRDPDDRHLVPREDAERERREHRRRRRPARGRPRRAGSLHRRLGRAWARRRSASSGCATSSAFRLDAEKLALAGPHAVAMHCLPAHVGEEITGDVLYGDRSLVWDQAENRLHAYKAVLALTVR